MAKMEKMAKMAKMVPKMVPKMVAPLLPGKRKKKRPAEAEMTMPKEKKIKLSAFWIMRLWKMPTIFVTLCKICFIFADFSGKVPEEREKGRGKDARKKAKRANLQKMGFNGWDIWLCGVYCGNFDWSIRGHSIYHMPTLPH